MIFKDVFEYRDGCPICQCKLTLKVSTLDNHRFFNRQNWRYHDNSIKCYYSFYKSNGDIYYTSNFLFGLNDNSFKHYFSLENFLSGKEIVFRQRMQDHLRKSLDFDIQKHILALSVTCHKCERYSVSYHISIKEKKYIISLNQENISLYNKGILYKIFNFSLSNETLIKYRQCEDPTDEDLLISEIYWDKQYKDIRLNYISINDIINNINRLDGLLVFV